MQDFGGGASKDVPRLKQELVAEEAATRVKAEVSETQKEEMVEGRERKHHKSGKKSKKKHKKKRRHSLTEGASSGDALQEEDETLGGFIERDPEAAIHEDPEDIVPVEGGIDSDKEADWTDLPDEDEKTNGVSSFDGALERLRQRRRRPAKPQDADLQLYCNKMLQRMSDAAQQALSAETGSSSSDEKSVDKGKPATAKLQMLNEVCTELVKVLAGWLAPLRDNALPNLSLRRRILTLLERLPITAQELAGNDLGRVLVLLWNHEDETEGNRQLIRSLIQKWTRPVLGLGSSHRQLMSERERAFDSNDAELQHKLLKAAMLIKQGEERTGGGFSGDKPSEQQASKRRRLPLNRGHNFIIQPKSQVEVEGSPGKTQGSQVPRNFKIAGRQPKLPTRAAKVSIEGRGL